MKRLNKKGFTLVELLAVIVILALLMVVATRTIGGSFTDSKDDALKIEIQKLLSQSYEKIQSSLLQNYAVPTNLLGASGKSNGNDESAVMDYIITEGEYTLYLQVNNYSTSMGKIQAWCGAYKDAIAYKKTVVEVYNGAPTVDFTNSNQATKGKACDSATLMKQ